MSPIKSTDLLVERVSTLCRAPVVPTPWKCKELVGILERLVDHPTSHSEFAIRFRDLVLQNLASNQSEYLILKKFMEHVVKAEPRLYADEQTYRDHLTHVTQVFLFGWIILNGVRLFWDGSPSWTPYGWSSEEDRFDCLNRAWMFASLLHDCSYDVQNAPKAFEHELRTKAFHQHLYIPGTPGRSSLDDIRKDAEPLWEARCSWFQEPKDRAFKTVELQRALEELYKRWDHGILGGIALWLEAQQERSTLRHILIPAALAIASHNFQHCIRTELGIDEQPNRWLRLDLWEEPLSTLLHLCDELQEWGRERDDENALFLLGLHRPRFRDTTLRNLEVSVSNGLHIATAISREMSYRRNAGRVRFLQELDIAKANRRLRILFSARTPITDFHVHLKAEQHIEGSPCRLMVRVSWPKEPDVLLEHLHRNWLATDPKAQLPSSFRAVQVLHPKDKRTVLLIENDQATLDLSRTTTGLRLAIVEPGGTGKSTLLQAVALQQKEANTVVLYIEDLPDRLVDIETELTRLHAVGSKNVVLIVDHLDRLADEDDCAYWLYQLRTLPQWLHAIIASRPEEYNRYFSAELGDTFPLGEWEGPPAQLADGQSDSYGRPLARALERKLEVEDSQALRRLMASAVSMERRRAMTASQMSEGVRFGKKPILVKDASGRTRFLHDSIQDILSAAELVRRLADQTGAEDAGFVTETLRRLPRDVPRLLLELLAGRSDSVLGNSQTKECAALALIEGLLARPTTQQWLYDTGRLEQAALALRMFQRTYASNSRIDLVASKFLGHMYYQRFSFPKLRQNSVRELRKAQMAARYWLAAASRIASLRSKEHRTSTPEGTWMMAFLSDHILLVLTRVLAADQKYQSSVGTWIKKFGADLKTNSQPGFPDTGWLHDVLSQLAIASSRVDVDRVFCSLETAFTEAQGRQTDWKPRFLDVRLSHLYAHLGNHFLSEAFVADTPDIRRLSDAKGWFQKSFEIRELVLDAMTKHALEPSTEAFGSLAQGYADQAHQQRGVVEAILLKHKSQSPSREMTEQLLSGHEKHEKTWDKARDHLERAERLPNMFRASLLFLGIGQVMATLSERAMLPGSDLPNADEIERKLTERVGHLLKEYASWGERHARFARGENDPAKAIRYAAIRDLPGLVSEIIAALRP